MTKAAIPDQIRSVAHGLGIRGHFVEELATREGITLKAAGSELLSHLQQSQPRIDGRASVIRDERDTFMERMANAMAHRSNPSIKLREDARPWADRRLSDIGREFLRLNGESTLGNDSEIFMRWGALHSTTDFNNFLLQVFNNFLMVAYQIAPSGLKLCARRATVNDFRLKHVYRNSRQGQLMPINPNGEFKRTTKADVVPETYQIQAFAAVFGISRQTLVNDDMGVFNDIAAQLAIQAGEFENAQLASLLVSNPVMSDGNPLFSAAHNNPGGRRRDRRYYAHGRAFGDAHANQPERSADRRAARIPACAGDTGDHRAKEPGRHLPDPGFVCKRLHRLRAPGDRSAPGSSQSDVAVVSVRRRGHRAGARI
jgi:hypothetical protein